MRRCEECGHRMWFVPLAVLYVGALKLCSWRCMQAHMDRIIEEESTN